ncbi:MAG: phosphoribosylanthranilate isomerase [Saprospiraceae bacterium]|nr:phosphoribosylanthranilate isomerase [Saprospiraceae bacterium]
MKVKICCISSIEEARLAVQAGAGALGLVGPMPSGPGVISLEEIANIVQTIPGDQDTFLLTSKTTVEDVLEEHGLAKTSTIQIVDDTPNEILSILKTELPEVNLVQVVHVIDDASLSYALEKASFADMLLLDSGNPGLQVKELGGTGRTHNWSISRKIVEQSPVPVFLAGGLRAENVRQAIDRVHPYGLDLCSGVRTKGQLDPKKLETFFEAVEKST